MSPSGNTVEEKRQAVHQMRSETLAQLYEVHPEAKTRINQAVGYGVFSNVGINLLLLSTASGWGVVRDQEAGTDTYMKMYSAGIGFGLGVKDFRGVFVFTSQEALRSFVEDGWDASAQADAAAKSADKGDAFAGGVDVAPGIKLYQLTQHGLALQATIQGTKFWTDDELNRASSS
jgi:lipid-binding SYLF domain-containing protein